MTQAYDKLKRLLEELFRLDREDVDFGVYRIMNHRRYEIEYWGMSKMGLEEHHVLFQKEDKHTYVEAMIERILFDATAAGAARLE